MQLTRRNFLKSSVAVLPAFATLPAVFRRAVASSIVESPTNTSPYPDRTLIIVQMAGGNDGLNTVIPFTDGKYYDHRSYLAVQENEVLDLNGEVGLHPVLEKMKRISKRANVVTAEDHYATFHDLRRGFGTSMAYRKRASPLMLKKLMRHKCLSTTMQYYAQADAELLQDMLLEELGDSQGDLPNSKADKNPREDRKPLFLRVPEAGLETVTTNPTTPFLRGNRRFSLFNNAL